MYRGTDASLLKFVNAAREEEKLHSAHNEEPAGSSY